MHNCNKQVTKVHLFVIMCYVSTNNIKWIFPVDWNPVIENEILLYSSLSIQENMNNAV